MIARSLIKQSTELVFGNWFLRVLLSDVRSMAWQVYVECIPSFSNMLDGTFSALYYIDYIPGLTIGGRFHSKPLTGGHAVKHDACSYMDTHPTAWLVAPAFTLVRFFYLAVHRSY